MLETDEDALVCDFAETYHIYDLRGLPLQLAATLALGLREDSRIKLTLSGETCSFERLALAACLDRLNDLVWMRTEDGQKNRNRPASVAEALMVRQKEPEQTVFETGEDFMKRWKELGGG